MSFGVSHNFRGEAAHLRSLRSQIPYALKNAINDTLFDLRAAEQREMRARFDRVTPYVERGVSVKRAEKDTLSGELEMKRHGAAGGAVPPGKVVHAEVYGGGRRQKRSERLWQKLGLLPANWYTVPGPAARIDAFGNMAVGQVLELLAFFKAFPANLVRNGRAKLVNLGDEARARRKLGVGKRLGREYFAVKPGAGRGGLRPGIYLRQFASRKFVGAAGRVRAVLFFVDRAHYRELYDFFGVAHTEAQARFDKHFDRRLALAIAGGR